jgi:hypothetical protein
VHHTTATLEEFKDQVADTIEALVDRIDAIDAARIGLGRTASP